MKRKKILVILFLILGMVFPQLVFTEDFTLRVPVNLSNLHDEVTRAIIRCRITDTEATNTYTLSDEIPLSIYSGNLNTIIEIKLDPPLNVDPTHINHYSCFLAFYSQTTGGIVLSPDDLDCINEWEVNRYRCGATGTITIGSVEGSIP